MANTAMARRGMVTAPHHLASEAGLRVLRLGGDAVEAAVATAATLAVVYPQMTGVGGDGFWLVAEPGAEPQAIDACGRAASAASSDFYRRQGFTTMPIRGPLAANTVAGTIAGWKAALDLGARKLPLSVLLEDAVYYAEHGAPATDSFVRAAAKPELHEREAFRSVFFVDGLPPAEGDTIRQPALAETLRRLGEKGLDDFYRGGLAHDLAADLAACGAPLVLEDLQAHGAIVQRPLSVRLRDGRAYNVGAPTQGFAALLILALFDRLHVREADGFSHVHGLVEATKQAFQLRDRHIEDPDAIDIDLQALLDDSARLDAMAAAVDPERAAPWPAPPGAGDTVWLGVVDGEGRAVSMIQSLYFEFGSGVVLPRTGVLWQNRGASFHLEDAGPNRLRPGAKPRHTLNPALVRFDDGRLLTYGTMGGEGQPQTQAAVFTRHARFGQPLQAAIDAPRWLLGRTWGQESTTLKLESRFGHTLLAQLAQTGHAVETVAEMTELMGHAGAILRQADGRLEGASDPRSDGKVAAW